MISDLNPSNEPERAVLLALAHLAENEDFRKVQEWERSIVAALAMENIETVDVTELRRKQGACLLLQRILEIQSGAIEKLRRDSKR